MSALKIFRRHARFIAACRRTTAKLEDVTERLHSSDVSQLPKYLIEERRLQRNVIRLRRVGRNWGLLP